MTGEAEDQSKRWALPASAVVHALVAALVIFGLPISLPQVPEEQAISVTIEPPPEAPPEPPPAPEAQLEPPPPPEPTPEPEAPQKAEAPPEPPPPEVEPAEPPPASQEQPAAAPVPVLRPVVAYGETDAGPRQSLDGSGVEEPAQPVAEETETPDEAETPVEEATTEEAAPESPTEDEAPPVEPAENPQPAKTTTAEEPEPAESATAEEPETTDDAAADEPVVTIVGPVPIPSPRPARPEPPQTVASVSEPALRSVPTLFSRSATGGPTATTAMSDIPRSVRVGQLCATELRLQLQNAPAPYFPDILISYGLKDGTVLKVPRSAFLARGGWYDLSFECQVDQDATRVVSFAFHVGEPISLEEARRRGPPSR